MKILWIKIIFKNYLGNDQIFYVLQINSLRPRDAYTCQYIKVTIIGPDNGLFAGRRKAIIWTTVGILLIGP